MPDFIIYFQNLLLDISPGLIPLLVFPISFVQSWHCVFMCGALQVNKTKLSQNSFLQGRVLGYSLTGAAYGFFGNKLSLLLEYQALGFLAYFFFLVLTLALIAQWLGFLKLGRSVQSPCTHNLKSTNKSIISSFTQGLLMTFIPCHLLFQIFGLATITGSIYGGFLVGLAHGLSSTPALWWGQKIALNTLKTKSLVVFFKILLGSLLILNLLYFSSKWLNPDEKEVKSKILFCF